MRARFWLLMGIFVAVLPLPAQTLKDLLLAQQIPVDSFSAAELGQTTGGTILLGNPEGQFEIFYDVPAADSHSMAKHVLKYNRKTGILLKSRLPLDQTGVCSGATRGMTEADDFTLVSTSISRSAGCVLVFDDQLQQKTTLYGLRPRRIAPNQIVLIEDMIAPSSVHPERLQLADLERGTTTELYPPQQDALRAKLARNNASHLPANESCEPLKNPCDPNLFDEKILGLATSSDSRFAFIVKQSTAQVTVQQHPPASVASQSVLYIYTRGDRGWLYCEVEMGSDEAAKLTGPRLRSWQFGDTAQRCTPSLPVVPDMATSVLNPYLKQQKDPSRITR